MRALTANAVTQLNSLQSGSAWFFLVAIYHSDLPAPYYFVNNTENVSAIGQTWIAYPFRLTLPMDDGQTLPSAEIEFDNVDRTLIDVIRGLATAPRIDLYAVLSSSPGVVEMSILDMQLTDISYDMQTISGRLIGGDLLNAPFPADAYDPAQFPAIFA